jgi:drug/metabolite transporter (DMT)-like permease
VHTTSPRRFGLPDLALLVTCACWGLNFVVTKSATADGPENFRLFIFNLIRFPAASLLLFITARFAGDRLGIERRDLAAIALVSFVGNFLYQIFYMVGQSLTSAANVGIVYGFTPLIIVMLSVAAKIERSTVFVSLGVLAGFAGLCLIMSGGGGTFSIDTGALLMLVAGCCWAVYAVFGKKILDKYPPVITTAWMLLFGGLYQLPLALWQLPHQEWATLSGQSILFVALSALFSLYTGYTLFYYAISRIGPARAGIYSNLTPVFTLIFASLIRGEDILAKHIIGLAVIITGIAITKIRLGERREARDRTPAPSGEKGV